MNENNKIQNYQDLKDQDFSEMSDEDYIDDDEYTDEDDDEYIDDNEINESNVDEDEDEESKLKWIQDQWKNHIDEWYKVDEAYWQEKQANNDEMTGGNDYIHSCDIVESNEFIQLMKNNEPQLELDRKNFRALDVGSGIGRVTQNVLLQHAHWVDLLERNKNFLEIAKEKLKSQGLSHEGLFFQCNLHNFPIQNFCDAHPILKGNISPFYDVIWIQWVSMYLTDDDFLGLLSKLSNLLKPKGVIVVKESISDELEIDKIDRSTTRTTKLFESIFEKLPHMYIVHSCAQKVFPEEYFGVHFWALKHIDTSRD